MAVQRGEAWLTCVTDDDTIVPALVLAESLKRTRTTKRIGVIICESVSKEKRVALRKAFDAFFLMDESFVPRGNITKEEQAKVYSFSLRVFDKVIFLSPNSLVLENADKLFEGTKSFKFLKKDKSDSIDLSCYLYTPSLELCEFLIANLRMNGKTFSDKYLTNWISKQNGKETGYIPGNTVLKFSMKSGSLLKQRTHAEVIQFVDAQKATDFIGQLSSLPISDMGLPETLITEKWLEIFHESVAGPLNDPRLAIPPSSTTNGEIFYNEPIAIIGMSCRYPGANNVDEFWNLLFQGEEGVREPPAFRWTKEHSLRVSQQERKTNAGFLSTTVDEFDARFFGVSPKEAAFMDPQARLLHEVMWESLEDSGVDPLSLYGTHTGIFTGSWMNDYKDIVQGSTERDFFRTYMGNSIGAAAARLSFLLGLTGPSIATESGCSSAIVALDLAVKSLRSGESTLALAGGVNLLLHPFTSTIMDYVIAPNGRCKTFDAKADGFGRAEGCGVLVLKRLSDALRDRDNIWAMIRGSAVSQEGLSRSLGTPTVHCEALAMKLALEDGNVNPSQVSFVETHGTGTAVGDPMEIAAIAKAYRSNERKTPLIIGSVKTNVGHTESCSGITGIMKTILAMQHELIPKHRNLDTLNPEIQLEIIPAKIPLEPIAWPMVKGQPRIAGISSFGITGTDGHVIIQEAPDYELPKFTLGLERPMNIMKIAGKTNEALEDILKNYEQTFQNHLSDNFADAAYTANIGRAAFNHRAFIVAGNYGEALKIIQDGKFEKGELADGTEAGKICFLFTGQGSQYNGMARTLYETSPVFRIHFDECDRHLRKVYGISISEVLWESNPSSKELSRTIFSQTSIFCVEYCLLKLWESWGIVPDYVLGHSLGEFAAAVAAGILDFTDALKLVAERSRLIDNLPRGSMLVVKADHSQVEKSLKAAHLDLDFAAINNPDQTVVAGNTQEIQEFLGYLKSKGFKAIILEATHAFHSRHMDPMLEEYRQIAETITYMEGNARCKYVSGMEGKIMDDPSNQINADYWVRHTREKVSFIDACKALRQESCMNFLEVGPQPVLSSFLMMNNEGIVLNCVPSLRRGTNEWQTILTSLGKLYLLGYKIDWKSYDAPYIRKKVSLPFHPFHRKSFWVESNGTNASIIHPLIGHSLSNASTLRIFQNDISVKSLSYLKDHCIGSRMVFPGAGYTEMCLSAGYCVANSLGDTWEQPSRAITVSNVRIDAPLELLEAKNCRVQVVVDLPEATADSSDQAYRVKVFHQNNSEEGSGKWVLHASSNFAPSPSTKDILKMWKPERSAELINSTEPISTNAFYQRVHDVGLKFGESFKSLTRYWRRKCEASKQDEVVAEMRVPQDFNKYLLHPLILDAMFQVGILTKMDYEDNKLKVPVRVGQLTLFPKICEIENVVYMHSWWEGEKIYGFLLAHDHTPIASMQDVELVETNVKTVESILAQQTSPIPDSWEETWRIIPGPFTGRLELPELAPILSDDFQHKMEALTEVDAATENTVNVKNTDRLIYLYTLSALHDLGWTPQVGEYIAVDEFCDAFHILPTFRQLVRFYFTIFQDEGLLEYDGNKSVWKVINVPSWQQIHQELGPLTESMKKTESLSVVVSIYEHISKHLAGILTGEKSALALLFPTDESEQQYSVNNYYQNHPGRPDVTPKILETAKTIVCNVRSMEKADQGVYRVLEVGAGTGSMSESVLNVLKEIWGQKFEYYYTDISQSFFQKAEEKFHEHKANIKFALFNIEENPLEQGIPLNYFDMVVCTDVIHATRSLQESLVHIRQTLRPRGALCFTETLCGSRDITFLFGLLSGYWRMEDPEWRPYHCCVGEQTWKNVLPLCGFQSVQVVTAYADVFGCITAEASPNINMSQLISPFTSPAHKENQKEWLIFTTDNNQALNSVATMLATLGIKVTKVFPSTCTESQEWNVSNVSIQPDAEDPAEIGKILSNPKIHGIIYGWGMDMDALGNDQKKLTLPFLHIAQHLLSETKPPKLYIFTNNVLAIPEYPVSNPSAATLLGMAKSLKNENSDLFVRYLDLEHDSDIDTQTNVVLFELAMIREHFQALMVAYRERARYEPRFSKGSSIGEQLNFPQSTERYHLLLPKSRMINDLEFETAEQEDVLENEVEVAVKCFALNFKDLLTILKPSAEFEQLHTVGLDFAGVVTKVGGNVSPDLKIGDRVFGANFKETQLPSHLVLEAKGILKIPPQMTYWEAATLPAVFATSLHCLVNVARMKKEDTVLIHTGSGGVGLAAIQLAKHIGAKIITTAGNTRKRGFLRSLGIEHVFRSRDTSFENEIMKATNGRGVDIVLNSITGPGLKEASLRVCAKNARFVEMSKLSIWTEEEVNALRPDVEYSIVDLTNLERSTWADLLDQMRDHLTQGSIKAIPFVKFDALYLRQAFQYFQKAKHIGKVVCVMPEVKIENGQFNVKVPLFNGDSTYLITGGLGGIGFEVCKFMLTKGATDIVLMGRSPPKPEIANQIKELNDRGYNIVIKLGDVGNFERCKAIINEISLEMKPLRGIQHSAGVLRDNLYHQQSWETFNATFTPKVTGTWNLHSLTRHLPLEHFVLYSSVSALIGTPGQPNHAAANCFEDTFAHYRHSLGLPANSINWGQWSQVGVAKEMNIGGIFPVSVKRMLNGLESTLRTQKVQKCFGDFDFTPWTSFFPITKTYLDERLLSKLASHNQNGQGLKMDEFWKEMDAAEDYESRIQIVSTYLKRILRASLRLDADEAINEDANIQDLGVDSLMLIELKNSIQGLFGSKLTVTAALLKNCHTVRELADALVTKLVSLEGEAVDEQLPPLSKEELEQILTEDCELDESIRPPPRDDFNKPSSIKTLLVTGCTGQLGPYIISELCKSHTHIEKIVCLIRTKEGTPPEDRLTNILNSMKLSNAVNLSKVRCVRGDVRMPNFGLENGDYDELCESVDGIIHCAVKGNHVEQYRKFDDNRPDIRSVNVIGTVNVLKFAATSKTKHVYYASAYTSIFGANESGSLSDNWPEINEMKVIVDNSIPGYQTSKYVCEMLLKQANARGIPCKVFRFPWIMGDSQTGQLNYASNHYILRFLTYLKLKVVPSIALPALVLPVDTCAHLSLKIFLNDDAPFEIFNIGHPNPELEQEFVRVAEQEFGVTLEVVEYKEFAEKMQTGTPLEALKELYTDVEKVTNIYTSEAFRAIQGYFNSPETFFENKKVEKYVPNFANGIESSMNIIVKNLKYVKATGFFEKFSL